MGSKTISILLAFICVLVFCMQHTTAQTCVGTASIRSNTVELEVDRGNIGFWSIDNNGVRINDFYNFTFSLTTLKEMPGGTSERRRCSYRSTSSISPLQEMDIVKDFNCTVTKRVADLYPGANVETILINYTSSIYPDFYFSQTFFSTDLAFEIRPSDNRTYVDPGVDYRWLFHPNRIKFNLELENWPWVGPSTGEEASHVLITWTYELSVFDTEVKLWDEAYYAGLNMTRKDGTSLVWELEKGGLFDGVPVVIADAEPSGNRTALAANDGWFSLPPLNMSIPLCAVGHYYYGTYDPSFVTLFAADPPTGAKQPQTPAQKKKNRDYVIGASIGSILGLGLVIVFVLIFFGKSTLASLDPERVPKPSTTS